MGESRSNGPTYVPALDGIRAVSVLMVLAFHLEVPGFAGGFLPVSLFFTLSGYLITQLILAEHDATGGFSLVHFWSRRFRRLMPAALLGIALVVGLALVTDAFRNARLEGDLGWALGYAANWRFVTSPQTYADLFTATASPVQHYWSLAIEEQFYVVLPLLMALVLTRWRRRVIPVLLVAFVASVVAGLLTESHNLVYYGSHVRAAELLAGSLLACVFPIGRSVSTRVARSFAVLGSIGLVLLVVAVTTIAIDDEVVYRGGLALFAFVSLAVIAGALVPGPSSWLLSRRPLVAIGRISYGLYVFHWPVIVFLDADRVGFDGVGLDLVRVGVTVLVTVASYVVLENPIRRRRVMVGIRRAAPVAFASVGVIVVGLLAIPTSPGVVLAGLDAPARIVSFGEGESASDTGRASMPAIRVAVLGPSISLPGELTDGREIDALRSVPAGCPIRAGSDAVAGCPSITAALADAESSGNTDLTVVEIGGAERALLDRLVGTPTAHDLLERPSWRDRKYTVAAAYAASIIGALGDRATIVIDRGSADALSGELAEWDARDDSIVVVDGTTWDSRARDVLSAQVSSIPDTRPRVLLLGDSTSFGLAQALDSVAGDRFDVLWAGGRNCPLVAVNRVRWWGDVTFDLSKCPRVDREWATVIPKFEPDLILMIYSVPEQAEQQYEPDGGWFAVGDAEFDRRHRESLERLLALGHSIGARFAFFSSPRVFGGALGGAPFASNERVDAWNHSIAAYRSTWPEIGLVDWATFVLQAEGTEPGSLRGDGVHLSADDLAPIVAERVVPAIEELLR